MRGRGGGEAGRAGRGQVLCTKLSEGGGGGGMQDVCVCVCGGVGRGDGGAADSRTAALHAPRRRASARWAPRPSGPSAAHSTTAREEPPVQLTRQAAKRLTASKWICTGIGGGAGSRKEGGGRGAACWRRARQQRATTQASQAGKAAREAAGVPAGPCAHQQGGCCDGGAGEELTNALQAWEELGVEAACRGGGGRREGRAGSELQGWGAGRGERRAASPCRAHASRHLHAAEQPPTPSQARPAAHPLATTHPPLSPSARLPTHPPTSHSHPPTHP